jgi:hypothetical protein
MMKTTIAALAAACALAAAGCSKNDEPAQQAPAPAPTQAGDDAGAAAHPHGGNPHGGMGSGGGLQVTVQEGVADFGGAFRTSIPEGWEYAQPASSMRAAEFSLPVEGGEPAELVVFYFGEGGAGGVQANLQRWISQFETEASPEVEEREMAGMPVTTVDVSGRYVAPVTPGAAETYDEANYRMFAAIVESSRGPFYFRMLGSEDAVAAHVDAALAMLESMEAGD